MIIQKIGGSIKKGQREKVLLDLPHDAMIHEKRTEDCGSGIYRPVYLYVSDMEYISQDGIKIETVSALPPCIRVSVEHTGKEIEMASWTS